MSSAKWQDLIEIANGAHSVDDLHRLCGLICDEYEYDYFIYGAQFPVSLVRPQILILRGYPDEWRDHYSAQGYLEIDPTVFHVGSTWAVHANVWAPPHQGDHNMT